MSAFIVSDDTMQKAVSILRLCTKEDPTRLGRDLYQLNTDAVNSRYSENNPAPDFTWHPVGPMSQKECIAAYKALRCLIYQCSTESEKPRLLYRWLTQAWVHEIAAHIVEDLAEYRAAAWG